LRAGAHNPVDAAADPAIVAAMAEPDLILHDARVVTLDPARPRVEALSVRDGRIAAVGASAELLRGRGRATRIVDAGGQTVTPGIFDAHPHMDREGLKRRGGIAIRGLDSVAGIVEIVREAASRTPAGEWIVTMPMELAPEHGMPRYVSRPDQLAEGRLPDRRDLDAAAPDHPVLIRSIWGWWGVPPFPSVANSAALALAGIDRDTGAPHGTEIERDGAGEPTGVMRETNRAPILEYTLFGRLPRFTFEDRLIAARTAPRLYNAAGTTAGFEGHGLTPAIVESYRRADQAGDLTVRLAATLSVPSAALDDRGVGDYLRTWADRIAAPGERCGNLATDGICLDFGDPEIARIIGAGYPYEQWAGHFYQSVAFDRLVEIATLAAGLGIRLACIAYDIEALLRAFEAVDARIPIAEKRWVIMHLTRATDDQLRRIGALGAMVTVTPNFMYHATTRLGLAELGADGTPIRRLLDAGIPVALSSDNVPVSMFWAMWSALTRYAADLDVRLGESFLAREEALELIARTGHRLTWDEDRRGTIAPGMDADFVVLDRDPLSCPEDDIRETRAVRTFLAGNQVYSAAAT